MPMHHWRTYFERRRDRPRPVIDDVSEIPRELRPTLAASLARFQLGETGEGRIVADLRERAPAWGLPDDAIEALRLFIAEEGRHAAVLGVALRALGGTPLRRSWSAVGFARVRRVAGPGVELLVLLGAEVAALCFYGTLVDRLPRGPLRAALAEIAADEAMHLRFHVALLGQLLPSPALRGAVARAFAPLGLAAAMVIVLDHRATLARLGVPRGTLLRQAHEVVSDTTAALAAGVPAGRRVRALSSWAGAPWSWAFAPRRTSIPPDRFA